MGTFVIVSTIKRAFLESSPPLFQAPCEDVAHSVSGRWRGFTK